MGFNQTILYGYWRSSAAYRVRIALNLKKVDYKQKSINLFKGEHCTEEYSKLNPYQKVPTLEIDGNVLSQSISILEYIEETRPEPRLLPEDLFQRQRVREIVDAIACDIHPIQTPQLAARVKEICIKNGVSKELSEKEQVKWMADTIQLGFALVEKALQCYCGRYSVGDSLTMADLFLVPQAYNALRHGVDLKQFPTISKLYDELNQIPAFKDAHPSNQPDTPQGMK